MMAEEAKRLMQEHLNHLYPLESSRPAVVVVDSATAERPYGWFFVYNSAKLLETVNMDYSLIGNGPILVRRRDGRVVKFSSFYTVDAAVAAYEADPAKFQPRA